MIIEIRRNVQVFFRRCQMKIRRADNDNRREDLLAVLELGKEHGWRLTPATLNQELLRQVRHYPLGVGVLRNMAEMGLVERDGEDDQGDAYSLEYSVTEEGINALSAGKVKFLETGIYAVHMSDDPLIPEFLIDVSLEDERTNGRAFQRNFEGLPSGAKKSLEEVPLRLMDLVGRNDLLPLLMNGDSFELLELQKYCARAKPQFDTTLSIRFGDGGISLYLEAKGQKVPLDPSRVNYDSEGLFQALMRACGQIPANGRMAIVDSYDRMTEQERSNFSRGISADRVQIPGLGVFENVEIGVPLYPEDLRSAGRWANDMIRNGLEQNMDELDFLKMKAKALDRFSPLFDANVLADRTLDWGGIRESALMNRQVDRATYWKLWLTDLLSAGGRT